MPEMNEASIYDALGVSPAEPQNGAGAKAQDPATPAPQDTTTPDEKGAKEQEIAAPAAQQRNDSAAQPAGNAGRAPEGKNQEPKQPEQQPDKKPEQQPGKQDLTEEQRKEFAAQRRRQEQQDAIDQAVNAAIAKEKERAKAEWEEFFKKANLKNTLTQQPITTLEEFNAWSKDFEAAKLRRDLQAGKLTPEALEQMIEKSPIMQKMEEITAREAETKRASEDAAAKAKIDAEIQEIQKLDPSIKETADLLKMPNAKEFYEYVKKGNTFLDAYYLANRKKLEARTAEAAQQQALSAARSKEHLSPTGAAHGAGAASVPADEMELFKLLNPNATDAEIQAYYNKNKT